ncbi:MAG: calcium-translocating P-type ATPase, SERCA-type, partial [Candidatus Aenigmatarchaeota archaeon]
MAEPFSAQSAQKRSRKSQKWHTLGAQRVLKELETTKDGLSKEEAGKRLEKFGPNQLARKKRIRPFVILARQFKSFLIAILFVAVLISFAIGHLTDALVILAILIANAVLGFVQEYRAEKALKALKKLAVPKAIVVRGGRQHEIPAEELVPGDIIILEQGGKVPADARLLEETKALKIDESMLTGESVPVEKIVERLRDVPLAERRNMLFMGTVVSYGRARAVVTDTGMSTQLGGIAKMIEEPTRKTPLQKKLDGLGKWLGTVILVISFAAFGAGVLYQRDIVQMFMVAIALAVSAVPEGLPAVVTITLALGINRMAKNNALVRKLLAVETLGSTAVICADKTGTMTTNEMTVQKLWCNGKMFKVTGVGFNPQGKFMHDSRVSPRVDEHLMQACRASLLCNNAFLEQAEGRWKVIGDPTEGALVVLAGKAGLWREKLKGYERVEEIPFTSERKMMSTLDRTPKGLMVHSKGAPEVMLKACTHIYQNKKHTRLTPEKKREILKMTQKMAGDGLRVIGLAFRPVVKGPTGLEKGLVFAGLAGMIDPPRPEVKEAIAQSRQAGIRTIMITGDHKLTAQAVAGHLGIAGDGSVLTGQELERMSDHELQKSVSEVSIYARVSPAHKVRILKSLKRKGQVVAMTGDGVNDAPALKAADIGVAMGIRGTDVAREASEMVLLDDNYATIVQAVGEGRGIYDNLRKYIRFTLAGNFDEIIVIALAVFSGLPLPLLPVQILWINLMTDGLPAVALSVDPKEPDIMKKKPRSPKEGIMSNMVGFIIITGIIASIATMGIFLWELSTTGDLVKARTMAFTVAILFEMLFVFNCRSDGRSVFRNSPLSNPKLIMAVVISVLLQVIVVQLPLLQPVFSTTWLSALDWLKVLGLSCLSLIVVPEVFMRRR